MGFEIASDPHTLSFPAAAIYLSASLLVGHLGLAGFPVDFVYWKLAGSYKVVLT